MAAGRTEAEIHDALGTRGYVPGGNVDQYASIWEGKRGALPREFFKPNKPPRDVEKIIEDLKQQFLSHDEFVMEKPQGSSLHHFLEYVKGVKGHATDYGDMMMQHFHLFVIEHDWSKAFKGSGEFNVGEFPFPYDHNCFEMRLNGVRILLLVGSDRKGVLAMGLHGDWLTFSVEVSMSGIITMIDNDTQLNSAHNPGNVIGAIGAQIRAVCIMLDAEVAETEVRRAPEKLNRIRERQGRTLLKDYHVVRLAHRHRVRAAEGRASDYDENYTRKRLHFRRGHDRHYQNYKVWIRWQLVGDPDLGFVDKEYRL